jgi:hypothetical protein
VAAIAFAAIEMLTAASETMVIQCLVRPVVNVAPPPPPHVTALTPPGRCKFSGDAMRGDADCSNT